MILHTNQKSHETWSTFTNLQPISAVPASESAEPHLLNPMPWYHDIIMFITFGMKGNSGPFIHQPRRALLKTLVIFIISTFAFPSLSFRTLWRRSKPSKTQRQQKEVWNSKNYIHPWRLTWNILIEVWKIIFLSKWVICRFHVNLPGCSFVPLHQIKHVLFPFTCSRLLLMEDIPNNHLRCKKNPVNNGTS